MTAYYVDTSALAKYYLTEKGTPWVRSILRPSTKNVTVICETTPIEMFSLLSRREAAGSLTPANAKAIRANFLIQVNKRYLVQSLESRILLQARVLVTSHKLRTLDAIQLASAVQASHILGESLTFLSADVDLLTAASAEGFAIDDPNAHP